MTRAQADWHEHEATKKASKTRNDRVRFDK
jgi:hypothetical protein